MDKPEDFSRLPATEPQLSFLRALAHEAGMTTDEVAEWAEDLFGQKNVAILSRKQASTLINALQRRITDRRK